MIIIAGRISTDLAHVQDLVEDLRSVSKEARTADGYLDHAGSLDDATAGTVLVLERWRDKAAQDMHLASPGVGALFSKWGSKTKMALQKYYATNPRSLLE